jgi:hypothetical protein
LRPSFESRRLKRKGRKAGDDDGGGVA